MAHQSKNGNGKCISVGDEGMCELIRETMADMALISSRHDHDAGLAFTRESLPGYEIVESVGSGGQGKVYKAYKKGEKRSVAIKVLLDGPFANRRQERRLWREIKLLRRLNHPGIITVHDSGSIRGRPYLVMPFVYGCPIGVHALADGLDLRQRIALFLEVCDAVSAAHAKGIVHRDLKPGNIMVDSEGRVRLLDFGLAKDMSGNDDTASSELSMGGQRVGTARYSSPEQIMGGTVDVQSDIYSLGVVLFELLSDEMPYVRTDAIYSDVHLIMNGERLRLREAVRISTKDNSLLCCYTSKDVGRDLETVLDTAMAIDPELRYATVDEFAEDLRRYIDRKPVKAQIGVGQRIRSRFKAYRVKLGVAVMLVLIAIASTIGMTMALHKVKESERQIQEVARIAQAGLQMGSFVRQATAKYDAREPDAAIAMLRQAVDLAELVPTDNLHVRRQAYQAYYNLAEYYFESNQPEEAILYCQKAIELSDALQKADPTDLLFMRLGSYSRRLSGRVSYALGSWSEAIIHFEIMLAVREELAKREPDLLHRQQEVASAHIWIGKTARKNKQLDKAVLHDKVACTISANVLDAEPETAEYAILLTHAEVHLASDYMSYKTLAGTNFALEIFARARQRVSQELNTTPGQQNRIADLIAAIDTNLATLNRRHASSENQ